MPISNLYSISYMLILEIIPSWSRKFNLDWTCGWFSMISPPLLWLVEYYNIVPRTHGISRPRVLNNWYTTAQQPSLSPSRAKNGTKFATTVLSSGRFPPKFYTNFRLLYITSKYKILKKKIINPSLNPFQAWWIKFRPP